MAALLSSGIRDQRLGITNASRDFRAWYRKDLEYMGQWGVRNGARGLHRVLCKTLFKGWAENAHGKTWRALTKRSLLQD